MYAARPEIAANAAAVVVVSIVKLLFRGLFATQGDRRMKARVTTEDNCKGDNDMISVN